MTSEELIEQLVALRDDAAQRRLLEAHVHLLNDDVADALKREADRLLRSDLDRSLQTTELLLYAAELAHNPLHRALGLRAAANARAIGMGDYQAALDLYDETADIYTASGRLAERAETQIGRIWALAVLGRYDEALRDGQWASRVLEEHAQWFPLGRLVANLGIIHGRLGEDREALALFDRAKELCPRLGERGKTLLAQVEPNRAIVLRNLGQFEESIRASRAAQQVQRALGHTVAVARAQQNLAVTYFVLGRYNEALEFLDQAREVFLTDGRHRDVIRADLFVSDCLLQLRRFADVLNTCCEVRTLFGELGARFEVALAFLDEAIAYAGLHRYAEALASLAEARRLFEEEGSSVWVASTDLEMAAILLRQGRSDESLGAAQACATVFQAYSQPVNRARAHLIGARAASALDRHDEALSLVTEALAAAESRDIPSLAYQGHHLLGSLAVAEGDAQKGLTEYGRAIQEIERLRGRVMVEFRADFLEDKQIAYEDIVRLCLDADQPLRALEYAERAKSRALLDLLAYRVDLSVQPRGPDDRPLVEELMSLRRQRDWLYRRWEAREESRQEGWSPDEKSRQQARQEVLELERRITELWHRLLIRNADYARDAALWQVHTEPVQPHLAPETLLLEYFVARGELIIFLVTAEGMRACRLPTDLNRIQQLLRSLWLNLRAVPRSPRNRVPNLAENARGLLQQLYALLIAPLGEAITPYPRLVIVPHGPLHYLPFHALYDGTSFLLERHEIGYLPGASLMRYCQEAPMAPGGLLALGYSHDGRLPYTVQEARSIAELWGGQAFVEDDATLTRLREGASDCRVLHLAAHGEFRPDNPLFSGLSLSDGWLTTLDVFGLRLRSSLVTLSGCQTGRSVVGGGDELLGLMRAFLYAGAASVLLTLWTVEDRSTAQLMQDLYHKLAAGWTKGRALRHAQLQFIERHNEEDPAEAGIFTHPYFWAPFCLVGDAGAL